MSERSKLHTGGCTGENVGESSRVFWGGYLGFRL